LKGKGWIQEAKLKGIRGVIDRRTERYSEDWKPTKRLRHRDDFELSRLLIEDVLVTIHLPGSNHRPISLSIFQLDCMPFRKQWLLYDIFCANFIVGIFDGCLFKYGPPQREEAVSERPDTREIHLKIDGIALDWFRNNTTGPLHWIKEGDLDINLQVLVPSDRSSSNSRSPPPEHPYFTNHSPVHISNDRGQWDAVNFLKENEDLSVLNVIPDQVEMRFKFQLNHIKLSPPIFSRDMSYINNALIHPIASYMNAHSKHIPLSFVVTIPKGVFDGSWTPADVDFWNLLSQAVYSSILEEIKRQKNQTTWKDIQLYAWKYLFGD